MAIKINGTSISITKGDSLNCKLDLSYHTDGRPYIPKVGDKITFGMRRKYQSQSIFTKDIPIDTLILQLLPEDTKDLEIGSYLYDIQIEYGSGMVDTFINLANFTLVDEVIV